MPLSSNPSKWTMVSAMFLVAGTCIGGGMLALPVSTGLGGFFPAICIMLVCWVAMTCTGLLLIEASLCLEEGAHIISMSQKFLGRWGESVSWLLYLFISYASLVAYTAGGGFQVSSTIGYLAGIPLSKGISCTLFILLFGIIIDFGAKIVGRVNAILFIGLIIAYFCMVGLGVSEIQPSYLLRQDWSISFLSIPLMLTSFSYQTMAPSLTQYLKQNVKWLRWSVIGGTTIAFLVYLVWELLILGVVPAEGENSLALALCRGEPATVFFRQVTCGRWIAVFSEFFAFFAIVTSFLGIALGLFDFLSDGLSISKKGIGKILLAVLIIIPTLFFAVYYEQAFLVAMDASGGFGDTIFSGILPVMMVWMARYRNGQSKLPFLPGGRPVLIALTAFFLFALLLEIGVYLGYVTSIYDVRESFLESLENFR